MSEDRLRAGEPAPIYRDADARADLMRLFDDGFGGLSARIELARQAGFHWDEVTEPFVVRDAAGAALGHVGVLEHRVVIDGAARRVAGVHAVVTRSDARGQGVARRALSEALAWADARYEVAMLATDLPAVYAPHGFEARPMCKFTVEHEGGAGGGRRLEPEDRAAFEALCPRRDPVSHQFASRSGAWLPGIDLALQGRRLTDLTALDALGAVVDWTLRDDGVLELHDVFAEQLPALNAMLELAPAHTGVELFVMPDRLAPDATCVLRPDDGVWMVRPGAGLPPGPIAISRLAEH